MFFSTKSKTQKYTCIYHKRCNKKLMFTYINFILFDAFELWCWRRLLRVPWTTRSSNQSIPKEISPEYSLEGLMLELKLQYSGHLMRRTDFLEKTLMLGKIEGRRRRGQQTMRWLGGIADSVDMTLSKLRGVGDGQGGLACCSPWVHKCRTGLSS